MEEVHSTVSLRDRFNRCVFDSPRDADRGRYFRFWSEIPFSSPEVLTWFGISTLYGNSEERRKKEDGISTGLFERHSNTDSKLSETFVQLFLILRLLKINLNWMNIDQQGSPNFFDRRLFQEFFDSY